MTISLITPCLNARPFIGDMLESVKRQDAAPLEHIVLDAGSTDGTGEILCTTNLGFDKVITMDGSGDSSGGHSSRHEL